MIKDYLTAIAGIGCMLILIVFALVVLTGIVRFF